MIFLFFARTKKVYKRVIPKKKMVKKKKEVAKKDSKEKDFTCGKCFNVVPYNKDYKCPECDKND